MSITARHKIHIIYFPVQACFMFIGYVQWFYWTSPLQIKCTLHMVKEQKLVTHWFKIKTATNNLNALFLNNNEIRMTLLYNDSFFYTDYWSAVTDVKCSILWNNSACEIADGILCRMLSVVTSFWVETKNRSDPAASPSLWTEIRLSAFKINARIFSTRFFGCYITCQSDVVTAKQHEGSE